jgi:hypothetical protein
MSDARAPSAAGDDGTPHLTPEQLDAALKLAEAADSVELKLTIPDSDQRSTVQALDMDPLDGEIRQVYFFDTPDLQLNRVGVVVRARRVQRRGDDTVVKLRPVVPDELPTKIRRSPNLGVEVDAMPGGFVCSASMKGSLAKPRVRETAAGHRPISKLFSKEQQTFLADHAPDGIGFDDLAVLGPINVLKLKFTPKGYKQRLVAELWLYPDTTRILELSTKTVPDRALDVATKAREFLASKGVNLSGEQQTKTKTALEFFTSAREA